MDAFEYDTGRKRDRKDLDLSELKKKSSFGLKKEVL